MHFIKTHNYLGNFFFLKVTLTLIIERLKWVTNLTQFTYNGVQCFETTSSKLKVKTKSEKAPPNESSTLLLFPMPDIQRII